MTRARRRLPLRQPRGPRATLPPVVRAERPSALDIHMWGTGCETCGNWNDQCTCNDDEE